MDRFVLIGKITLLVLQKDTFNIASAKEYVNYEIKTNDISQQMIQTNASFQIKNS